MNNPTTQLRTATRRAKSDVANKLVSMFLHEFSRSISQTWPIRIESPQYAEIVERTFQHQCPYCSNSLITSQSVVEHMDGMNRYRAGLHVPGNVVIACKACNSEKRRDDSLKTLVLAPTGWESFLSHDGVRCVKDCRTCRYWLAHWGDNEMQQTKLSENLHYIRDFRSRFSEFQAIIPTLQLVLPELLTKLYSDCQSFAETEIKLLLERFNQERLLNPVSSNRP